MFFPGSDRRAKRVTRDYRVTGADGVELHHLYRATAWLGENMAGIEEQVFDRTRDLFTSLSVVFFDTTSIYFEGAGGRLLSAPPVFSSMPVGLTVEAAFCPGKGKAWPRRFILVRGEGFQPSRLSARIFKTRVSSIPPSPLRHHPFFRYPFSLFFPLKSPACA